MSHRIRLGISSCLLGQKVRFDGNHKQDGFITGTLSNYFEFVPVCPEVAIGLDVPRPPIRLTGDPHAPRAVGVDDPLLDVTEPLARYGARQARTLSDLSGYIFKSRSPSCGMERVRVYGSRGPAKVGRGIYASAFLAGQPWLPAEEEGRLTDPELRDNFLERVFAYRRWQALEAEGITAARLIAFHSAHKLTLLAHGSGHDRSLGRLVAQASGHRARAIVQRYLEGFMGALGRPATRTAQTNVLQHAAGYLKRALDKPDRHELAELIHAYRRGELPLAAPVTLLRHHFRRHPTPWIAAQTYLYPDSHEFILRYGMP